MIRNMNMNSRFEQNVRKVTVLVNKHLKRKSTDNAWVKTTQPEGMGAPARSRFQIHAMRKWKPCRTLFLPQHLSKLKLLCRDNEKRQSEVFPAGKTEHNFLAEVKS